MSNKKEFIGSGKYDDPLYVGIVNNDSKLIELRIEYSGICLNKNSAIELAKYLRKLAKELPE